MRRRRTTPRLPPPRSSSDPIDGGGIGNRSVVSIVAPSRIGAACAFVALIAERAVAKTALSESTHQFACPGTAELAASSAISGPIFGKQIHSDFLRADLRRCRFASLCSSGYAAWRTERGGTYAPPDEADPNTEGPIAFDSEQGIGRRCWRQRQVPQTAGAMPRGHQLGIVTRRQRRRRVRAARAASAWRGPAIPSRMSRRLKQVGAALSTCDQNEKVVDRSSPLCVSRPCVWVRIRQCGAVSTDAASAHEASAEEQHGGRLGDGDRSGTDVHDDGVRNVPVRKCGDVRTRSHPKQGKGHSDNGGGSRSGSTNR